MLPGRGAALRDGVRAGAARPRQAGAGAAQGCEAPAGTPWRRGGCVGLPRVGEPRAVPAAAWTGDGSAAPAQGPASPAARQLWWPAHRWLQLLIVSNKEPRAKSRARSERLWVSQHPAQTPPAAKSRLPAPLPGVTPALSLGAAGTGEGQERWSSGGTSTKERASNRRDFSLSLSLSAFLFLKALLKGGVWSRV